MKIVKYELCTKKGFYIDSFPSMESLDNQMKYWDSKDVNFIKKGVIVIRETKIREEIAYEYRAESAKAIL